ncbi:MAG: YezD family protein [Sphingobium sp.]
MNRHATLSPKPSAGDHVAAVEQISQALAGLRFGAISVVVHDGRVTQIDVTEKRRLVV